METEWMKQAKCRGNDISIYFDKFEASEPKDRQSILNKCIGCPVMKECDRHAKVTFASGVHAAGYYSKGRRLVKPLLYVHNGDL